MRRPRASTISQRESPARPSNVAAKVNQPLTATGGVYTYGKTATFPQRTYASSNYFVDVEFQPSP